MKLIPLTKGQFAKVDDDDYERLARHSWYATWSKSTKSFYAARGEYLGRWDGRSHCHTVLMHREILGLEYGDPREGDHDNHDTLDNQRLNLRIATTTQNCGNGRKKANNTSGFKGVAFHRKSGKYQASIGLHGKQKYLGLRDTPEAAHALYCEAANEIHGEFARMA